MKVGLTLKKQELLIMSSLCKFTTLQPSKRVREIKSDREWGKEARARARELVPSKFHSYRSLLLSLPFLMHNHLYISPSLPPLALFSFLLLLIGVGCVEIWKSHIKLLFIKFELTKNARKKHKKKRIEENNEKGRRRNSKKKKKTLQNKEN